VAAARSSTPSSTPGRGRRLRLQVGFLVDRLTVTMMCVVTFVSLMVHVYTIGYMADDPGYQRFFAYISLFTFSMMMLVMANNFLQLFFGWEAVGLVSYLLIGFWFTRPTAIYANLKAFLVNRVGDFGFLLGIGIVFALRHARLRAGVRASATPNTAPTIIESSAGVGAHDAWRASASSSAPWARARSSRCTCGSPTRWKAPRRSPR
jgi:NADH:ubiquinone oxidoreductase subunit 5 (subunit L)/multisubunit Na+/H+ antiporter MnhA subunit